MPLYEYSCEAGHVFDGYSTVEERNAPRECACGKAAHKVILHPPRVFGDFEGYESPATGRWVEGRRARAEDLRVSGCRPYELGEKEDLSRRQAEMDRKLDAQVDVAVEQTLNEITGG